MRLGETLDGRRISGMDYSGVEARRPHFGKRLVETGELLAEIGLRLFVGSREVRERALEEQALMGDGTAEIGRIVRAYTDSVHARVDSEVERRNDATTRCRLPQCSGETDRAHRGHELVFQEQVYGVIGRLRQDEDGSVDARIAELRALLDR